MISPEYPFTHLEKMDSCNYFNLNVVQYDQVFLFFHSNGMDIEGIEHERFKELMKNSGDEVELVVITPKDAKMLDIPASVTIHKSDGSTLSITDPDVLQNQNIDEAIQNEEKVNQVFFFLFY